MDIFSMSTDELRAHNRNQAIEHLRKLHVTVTLRRPMAGREWDNYVTFLRSKYQSFSDEEVDALIVEVRSTPVTSAEADPKGFEKLKQQRGAREAKRAALETRTPEEKRRHRRSLTVGFSLIVVFWVVILGGMWLLTRGAHHPSTDRDHYYPGEEVCELPPAAWGEPETCSELP